MNSNFKARSLTLKAKQKGSAMIEYGLYLVIGTVALVAIYSYFSSNANAANAESLSGNLVTLMGKTKQNYANNYAGVTNAKLSAGGFFRGMSSMNDVAGAVTLNMGGGTLTVAPGTVVSANDSISYVVTNVPDDSCLPFATSIAKSVTKLTVGVKTVKAPGGQPDPSQVVCSGDANTFTMLVQ